jgi:TRAP-type mannitol/chloroaromatic compound transport system substrate-binding protein
VIKRVEEGVSGGWEKFIYLFCTHSAWGATKMKKNNAVIVLTSAFMIALFILVGGTVWAAGKSVELKLWSAWPNKMDPSKPGLNMLIDMINEKGEPVNLSIKYVGGPEIFGPFQGCESVQKGIVDIAYTAGAYNTGVIPEVDALKLIQTTPWEDRKSGAFALLNKWHNEKGMEFLARASSGQGFQGFLNKDRTKPDLSGLTMRVVPIYVCLLKPLHAKGVTTAGGEVYTALERGTVDGFWWGGREIRPWGWNEVCKYIWGPPLWTVDVYVFMNKNKWDSLDDSQRKLLTKLFEEYEKKTYDDQVRLQSQITQELIDGGMKEIKFSPEDTKWYINMAYEEGWKAALQKSSKVKELRPLVSKKD